MFSNDMPKLPAALKNLLSTAGYIFRSVTGADKELKEIDHLFLPLWDVIDYITVYLCLQKINPS